MKLSFFSLWKLAKFLKKHKSVVLQNLHQYSVPSNITSLYFFNSIGALKSKILRPWSVWVKIRQIPHVRFETTSQTSSSNCTSFFIFMTHNSSVYFKLMHFLLWIKGSHQSPNFETFECSGEYLPYYSCHIPNHKSVFLQFCITLQCHER